MQQSLANMYTIQCFYKIEKLLTQDYTLFRGSGSVGGTILLAPFATEPNLAEVSYPQVSISGRKQVYKKIILSISFTVTHTNGRRTPMRSFMEQSLQLSRCI